MGGGRKKERREGRREEKRREERRREGRRDERRGQEREEETRGEASPGGIESNKSQEREKSSQEEAPSPLLNIVKGKALEPPLLAQDDVLGADDEESAVHLPPHPAHQGILGILRSRKKAPSRRL